MTVVSQDPDVILTRLVSSEIVSLDLASQTALVQGIP